MTYIYFFFLRIRLRIYTYSWVGIYFSIFLHLTLQRCCLSRSIDWRQSLQTSAALTSQNKGKKAAPDFHRGASSHWPPRQGRRSLLPVCRAAFNAASRRQSNRWNIEILKRHKTRWTHCGGLKWVREEGTTLAWHWLHVNKNNVNWGGYKWADDATEHENFTNNAALADSQWIIRRLLNFNSRPQLYSSLNSGA